jgi:hypothetical protein
VDFLGKLSGKSLYCDDGFIMRQVNILSWDNLQALNGKSKGLPPGILQTKSFYYNFMPD